MGKRYASDNYAKPVSASLDQNAVNELVKKAIKTWKEEYECEIAALKVEIQEVKDSQQFISTKYETLKTNYDSLMATNKQQAEEIKRLKILSNELETRVVKEGQKVESLEQYGRKLNLEITGVPVKDEENTNDIVVEIAKLANVDLSLDQISTSHRLPVKPKRPSNNENVSPAPPPIIVRFISRNVRNTLYVNRQNLRQADFKTFSVEGTSSVYVNENLTRYRKKLFWSAKQKVKSSRFKYIWTADGNIFLKKSDQSHSLMIKSEKDLELIK